MSIFVFVSCVFGVKFKKIIIKTNVVKISLFSSRSFIFSGLTFKCLLHLEFIFVYGVRECFDFILLHAAV